MGLKDSLPPSSDLCLRYSTLAVMAGTHLREDIGILVEKESGQEYICVFG